MKRARGDSYQLTVAAVAMAALVITTCHGNADPIAPIVSLTGSHGGDQYGSGMIALTNGSGMLRPDPLDPSTWSVAFTHYSEEWMASYLVGATNSKLAWASFDLGASTALQNLYLWNVRYQGGIAGTQTYNLYYANSPAVALPTTPPKGSYSVTGLTPQGDYSFAGGGWTLFNTSGFLTLGKAADDNVDLIGTTARYVAVEILLNHGDTYKGGRVGFTEVAITYDPPPIGMVLIFQ